MTAGREALRFRLAGPLGRAFVGVLYSTIRVIDLGRERYLKLRTPDSGVLYLCWHDQLLSAAFGHRNEGIVVLISEHADGEYIARIVERMGFGTARGSSTRGGAKGLRSLVQAGRRGRDLAITTDGPRGPRHVVKEGTVVAAQLSGLPVVPIGVATSRSWELDSWDRFRIPKPFSRVVLAHGEPIQVPRELEASDRPAMVRRVQEGLEAATREAEATLEVAT